MVLGFAILARLHTVLSDGLVQSCMAEGIALCVCVEWLRDKSMDIGSSYKWGKSWGKLKKGSW